MTPSIALKYFKISEGNPDVLCKLCNKLITCRIRYSTCDTSHMLRHLKRHHPMEMIGSTTPAPVNVESELKTFFNSQGEGCSTESYTRDSSPGRVEQSDVSTFRELDVTPTALLDVIQKIAGHVKDVMTRLTNVEAMLAKCDVSDLSDDDSDCDDEIQKQNEEPYEEPKRNIITVKGFSFEDYPH